MIIQIRDVPDELYRKLNARAAREGIPLSAYLLQEIEQLLERPTRQELLVRLRARQPVEPKDSIAAMVAAERRRRR